MRILHGRMLEKETIIKTFINNFIQDEKAERSFLELTNPGKRYKFADRLNHQWYTVLNMKYLVQVDKTNDNAVDIQKQLHLKDNEICYVISNYPDYDNQLLPFKDVFSMIYSKGLATILINQTADTLFLDTEQERGPADRFIGKRIIS